MLEKPEDHVLYRPRSYGGLGLVHIESKSLALLIRSFLESAVNPTFRRNKYHEALFKWHIEHDRSIPNPGLPPYYPELVFIKIRQVKQEGLLNITTMPSAYWYKVLPEDSTTHQAMKTTSENIYHAELNSSILMWIGKGFGHLQ